MQLNSNVRFPSDLDTTELHFRLNCLEPWIMCSAMKDNTSILVVGRGFLAHDFGLYSLIFSWGGSTTLIHNAQTGGFFDVM